ncbi:ribonucleoside-diphosphate reductase subunit alpha [Candidatus Uhrbacteria bacterium]|nr:ribonucleoside-diphosphate reductase subunit alpha [Candidatus Uhrbacteria bacterium]
MALTKIKKRNGSIVEFDRIRIESAVQKAFNACGIIVDSSFFPSLTDEVVSLLEGRVSEGIVPGVEDVQDIAERIIAQHGYFDVARAYIIYRYEHTKQRVAKQQELREKIERNELVVIKRSGAREQFMLEKLERCLSYFTIGLENQIDKALVARQCRNDLYDGVATQEVFHGLVMATRTLIEVDPAYSRLASRLLLHSLYSEAIGEGFDVSKLEQQYRTAFVANIKNGVEIGRLDPRLLTFDLERLSRELVLDRDDLLRYLGTQVLYDRYFLRDPYAKRVLETPQAFWMRVAMGLALKEKEKMRYAKEFYEVASTLRYVPSTPTLFHAGTEHPQLSSCYLNTVTDSLDHIFKVISDNAQLSKWSGGIGTDWSNVRATGALIQGIGVESQGVVPFLKVSNDATHAINRSGRRRGAACVYLEIWHHDIEDYLELRKNTGDERRRTHDINTANWIPDLFMKRVQEDGGWTLFSPHEVPDLHHLYGKRFEERYGKYEQDARDGKMQLTKTVKARDLWKKMLSMLYETGHPWITFKDPCNVRSPQDHAGVVHSSNLCTEITLNTSEEETAVCNLGSINFAKHMKGRELDIDLLSCTIPVAMRMLDNVVDVNYYPTKEARASNLRHRPVGLGVMGFQDALYMKGIQFDSEECVRFADESMEVVAYHAILASSALSRERGSYASYSGSKWDRGLFPVDTIDLLEQERGQKIDMPRTSKLDWSVVRQSVRRYGMRNSNCLAIAPTATISNIAGTVPSIEPIYKNIYVKSNMSGDFTVVNPYLVEDLKSAGLWDYEMLGKIKYHDGTIQEIHEIPQEIRQKYKEVFEIDPVWIIKAAAYRGKWIDQSQSLNVFFHGASGKKLSDTYLYAWQIGLKTTYYLRTLAASQVEKATLDATEYAGTHLRKQQSSAQGFGSAQQSEIRSAISIAVSAPVPPVEMASALEQHVVPAVVATIAAAGVPLCKIEDPDCESCQ